MNEAELEKSIEAAQNEVARNGDIVRALKDDVKAKKKAKVRRICHMIPTVL